MTRIGINGFGRIGRQVLKAMIERYPKTLQVAAVNDLFDVETNAHLFKYDTNYGRFQGTVAEGKDQFIINGQPIRSFALPRPCPDPLGRRGRGDRHREHGPVHRRRKSPGPPPGGGEKGHHLGPGQGRGHHRRDGCEPRQPTTRRSTASSPTPPARPTALRPP